MLLSGMTEYDLHMMCVEYLRVRPDKPMFWHTPNGEYRSKSTGARLKRMGTLPGVSDLFIAQPNQFAHGLFIELKRDWKSKCTSNQKIFLKEVHERGYAVTVQHDFDIICSCIDSYLSGKLLWTTWLTTYLPNFLLK